MKYIAGIFVAVLVSLVGASAAQALDITSVGNAFPDGPYEQAAGEVPNYVNPVDGNGPHNLIAEDDGPDGEPLFSSDFYVPTGSTSPIAGAQYLSPGTYHFVCTIHPGMESDLKVTGGTPVARPEIKLTIPSQKLKKVRKSGKLKVDVKGVHAATGVDLEVDKGTKAIGAASDLSVDTGKTLKLSIALTSAGKKAIKKGKKVTVSAQGSVPFGSPKSAKSTLR